MEYAKIRQGLCMAHLWIIPGTRIGTDMQGLWKTYVWIIGG